MGGGISGGVPSHNPVKNCIHVLEQSTCNLPGITCVAVEGLSAFLSEVPPSPRLVGAPRRGVLSCSSARFWGRTKERALICDKTALERTL